MGIIFNHSHKIVHHEHYDDKDNIYNCRMCIWSTKPDEANVNPVWGQGK